MNLLGRPKFRVQFLRQTAHGTMLIGKPRRVGNDSTVLEFRGKTYFYTPENFSHVDRSNQHTVYIDIENGDTVILNNRAFSKVLPEDATIMISKKIAKEAVNAVGQNIGLITLIAVAAACLLGGILMGQILPGMFGGAPASP